MNRSKQKRNHTFKNTAFPDKKAVSFLRKKIIRWFNKYERKYPWRKTKSAFKLLIAEMMLRRTKADQVKPVYIKLLQEYPEAKALANAANKKIDKILYPLGLKWRNPAFKRVARTIVRKFQGKVPTTRKELTSLPGVGEYVAGAILSIAFNKKEWIVDSNVVRVLKRYFGIATSKEGRRDKHVIDIAKIYASGKNPRKANLGLLDICALVCTPQNPKCNQCPLRLECKYAHLSLLQS